jgi:hypothetical protein
MTKTKKAVLGGVLLLIGASILGCSKTIDRGHGWRIKETYSPLMEGAPLRSLEIRPSGDWRWKRVEEIVSLWKPLKGHACVVVAVPAPRRGGRTQGEEIWITCDGSQPRLVFQNPDVFYIWGPDGIYAERPRPPDGIRGDLWVTFDTLLERYESEPYDR